MKITPLQFVLAASVSLLAVFWMKTVLLYAVLICTIIICSWLLGLMLYLQSTHVPVAVDGSASVCDDKSSLLYSTEVRVFLFLLLIL